MFSLSLYKSENSNYFSLLIFPFVFVKQQIFQDINAALNLWLSISIPDHCSADDPCSMVPENTMILLYNIIDLLSMKVCFLIVLGAVGSALQHITAIFLT